MFIHVTSDKLNTAAEFEKEMATAKSEVDAYLATSASAVDENTVVALTDGPALDAGAKIFATNCAACHLADGGGSVGPNLTDEYWIHGGGITNVFTTVKYGVPAKGMIAWKDQLSPVQIQQVASYILTLKGTTPATPKAPEGDLWKGDATPTDGTTAPADTTQPVATETPTTPAGGQ
jgi:cytochrome c oxidase cbb3-type subunit 3